MNNDNTIKDILLKSDQFFKTKGIKNSRLEAELILSHFLKLSRFDLYLKFDQNISDSMIQILREAVMLRSKHKPLQYITQTTYFHKAELYLNEKVLIPRPETELMVEMILKNHSESRAFLDIGTGSGAITIALALEIKGATFTAVDISEEALIVARKNAENNHVNINFKQSDLFSSTNETYDVIISNPPYVSEEEYAVLEPELYYEPKLALVSDNKGLSHIFKIIQEAQSHLNIGGYLYLEIGSNQAEEIKDFACQFTYESIEVFQDLNQFDRIVRLKK